MVRTYQPIITIGYDLSACFLTGLFHMKSPIGMFLGAYSLFLAGEKSKEQDSCEVC